MTLIEAAVLGIIQGLTEFLPISSSGHLVLAELWLRLPTEALQSFDVLLHAGTLVALLLCYPKEWRRMLCAPFTRDREALQMLLLIIIATVPGAVAGVAFADFIEHSLRSVRVVGVEFLLNAVILLLAETVAQQRKRSDMRIADAVWIGLAQAFALSPGLSRSALTVSAGRVRGLHRRDALDFSFLIAFPIIAGATLYTFVDIAHGGVLLPPPHITVTGIATSLVASVCAIVVLKRFVASYSLAWFALYLVPMGLLLCVRL